MESKKGLSKKVVFGIVMLVLLVILVIAGAFYIYYKSGDKNVDRQNLDGGSVSLTYTDDENLFVVERVVPTSDIVGTKLDSAELYFDFTVKSILEEANNIEYEVIVVEDEEISTIDNSNIRVYLEKEEGGTYTSISGPLSFIENVGDKKIGNKAMSLYKTKRSDTGNDNYRLRAWVSDTAVLDEGANQKFAFKVAIKGTAN